MGQFKEVIYLLGPEGFGPRGSSLAESSVVWKRVPFLSSLPERVSLGERPMRVFLRCPDESVELTDILSAPLGIKAVVSSPRELIVKLDGKVRTTIDGTIEVGTTAKGRPPLRVPVVHYVGPLAKSEPSGL
jgi:hypothetical protein